MQALKKVLPVFVLSAAFVGGLLMFDTVMNRDHIDRDPAAVKGKIFDVRSSNPDQLRQEILNRLRIQPVLEANNFVSKSLLFSGLAAQICKTHEKIELEFVADGVSVGGDQTKMIVSTQCSAGQNPLEVGAIKFPIQEILNEKPRSAEFKFSGYSGTFQFVNVSDVWPSVWILSSVRFKSSADEGKTVGLDLIKAEGSSAAPVVLEF